MPNIIITNRCNLRCPYCFAEEKKNEMQYNMPYQTFLDIVKFITTSAQATPQRIGIIGGEPTLHPDIELILYSLSKIFEASDNACNGVMFSNGIELAPLIPLLPKRFGVLINYNKPGTILSDEQVKKTEQTFYEVAKRGLFTTDVSIGCNLYPGETDYDYIWDVFKYYGGTRLRLSVAAPCASFTPYRSDRHKYFQIMKEPYLDMCRKAIENHVIIGPDCGFIPECALNEKEVELVKKATGRTFYINEFCATHSCIDIDQNFNAISCFGRGNIKANIKYFESVQELEQYFGMRSYAMVTKNLEDEKCKDCKWAKSLKCQGGCLSFANVVPSAGPTASDAAEAIVKAASI